MPDSSVDSYINAQPETVMSKDQFYQSWMKDQTGWSDDSIGHYNDLNYKVAKFFGDTYRNRFDSEYEAYLNNVNNRNEFIAQQSARAYDRMMDDTKYQRMMKDFEAAGLNPYLLVNNGGISASSAPSSSKADYKASSKNDQKANTKSRDIALIILALSRVAAALL